MGARLGSVFQKTQPRHLHCLVVTGGTPAPHCAAFGVARRRMAGFATHIVAPTEKLKFR